MKPALAIIPARGGSKGVLRKNIRLLGGIPLITYTIRVAQQSHHLSHFLTSTDNEEIARVAEECGSPVLMRPARLARDDTPMLPVIQHVLDEVAGEWEYLVLLQPTAPFRTAADIDGALELLESSGADSVLSVYEVGDAHPARMYRLENRRLIPYDEEPAGRLRQQLPSVYHRNGAIYACKVSLVREQNTLIGSNTCPYFMPRERSVNIDDELDLAFADFLMRCAQNREGVV